MLDGSNVQHKIRVQGIDAPELGQPFGRPAGTRMSEMVFGKDVDIEIDTRDRYNREVGKVLVDGMDAGLRLIDDGLAWHYKHYESEQSPADRAAYARAEQDAREARRGLWTDPNPIPPWDWRRTHKSQRRIRAGRLYYPHYYSRHRGYRMRMY